MTLLLFLSLLILIQILKHQTTVQYLKWGLCLWPLLVIYSGIFEMPYFLTPLVGREIAGWISFAIPLLVLGTTLIHHWRWMGNTFTVMTAIIGNVLIGGYNLWWIAQVLIRHFPKVIGGQVIVFVATMPWLRFSLYTLPLFAAFLATRYLWSHPRIRTQLKVGPKNSETFGTACLADLKTMKKLNLAEGIPVGAMPTFLDPRNPQKTARAIKKEGGNEIIRLKVDHATIIAPSRTGKGVGIVIPTLLEYPGAVFVTDIKGENYAVTGRAREALNRQVIAFDPFGITNCSEQYRINPLDFLDATQETIVDDSQTLAHLICPTHAQDGTNAGYFQSQGCAVIQCLLLYVVCSPNIKKPDKNLSTVYHLLCSPLPEFLLILEHIGQDTTLGYGTASNLANRIHSTDPRERSGIINSACVEMRFVDTPNIRNSTLVSDINLKDITKGEMDLFVCIPPEKLEEQSRLLRLLTGIVFIEMQRARGRIAKHNLLMLIDEAPALGHMKQIDQLLMYGGGYGITLIAIAQTIELMRGVYPKSWETFLSNQLAIFFGCTDPMTCEFVSKMLGAKTVDVSSNNYGSGTQRKWAEWFGSLSNQSGSSMSETGRPLLMPNEIKKLGDRVILAFLRGEAPMMCQRIDYRERIEWQGSYDQNPLHENRAKQSYQGEN
jgi:type IV secretory pathway TraG/TraD family ATPase VirD4